MIKSDGGESRFIVQDFALKEERDGTVTLITPALSFADAEKILNQYWFAPLISMDFSPAVTRVNFPDDYTEKFYNQISIPALRHALRTQHMVLAGIGRADSGIPGNLCSGNGVSCKNS